jgi:hypothetical protein
MLAVSPRGSPKDKHKKILPYIFLNPDNNSDTAADCLISLAQIAFHIRAALRKFSPTFKNAAECAKKTFD